MKMNVINSIPSPNFEYALLSPILLMLVAACVGVLIEAFVSSKNRRFAHLLVVFSALLLAFFAVILQSGPNGRSLAANGTVALDGPGWILQATILLAATLSALLFAESKLDPLGDSFAPRASTLPGGQEEKTVTKLGWAQTEIWPLFSFAVSGMLLFVTANDLLVLFVALEVMSLPLYLLAGLARRRRLLSQEASLKYFILGALASAVLLFGSALTYAYTGSLEFGQISNGISSANNAPGLLTAAIALVAVGMLFKIGAVPFHQWVPDVYTGSPTPVTTFMAGAVKVAAFGGLLRVFYVAFGALVWDWRPLIWVVAGLTMIVGSVIALSQSDFKRMLAYSSISNGGFILVGFSATNKPAIAAVLFYLIAYTFATVGAFALLTLIREQAGESSTLIRWKGLGRKSPFVAALMSLFMLSFAGIPLTSGFTAKFGVFTAAITGGATPLVLIGVVASAIAAVFYVRVIILMFFADPIPDGPFVAIPSPFTTIAISVCAIVTVVLGVFPQFIIDVISSASVFLR
jgi:NADH-quinone oxidoreductase subunit N